MHNQNSNCHVNDTIVQNFWSIGKSADYNTFFSVRFILSHGVVLHRSNHFIQLQLNKKKFVYLMILYFRLIITAFSFSDYLQFSYRNLILKFAQPLKSQAEQRYRMQQVLHIYELSNCTSASSQHTSLGNLSITSTKIIEQYASVRQCHQI